MNSGTGDIKVTAGEGGSEGVDASLKGAGRTGTIRMTHGGTIVSEEGHGIYGSIRGAAADFEAESISRDATSTGTIKVETAKGSKVTGGGDGIHLWHNGGGTAAGQDSFAVTIRGMVTGGEVAGSTEYAGVRIAAKGTAKGNGGTIVVGPYAHVTSGSGVAIQADDYAGDVVVLLEKDEEGFVSHVEGKILSKNADTTGTMEFRTRPGQSGSPMDLEVGDRVNINLRDQAMTLYDVVKQAELKEITGGFQFEEVAIKRMYKDRARVFEAVPSLLLSLMEPMPYTTRTASPRMAADRLATDFGWSAPAHLLYPANSSVALLETAQGDAMEPVSSGRGVWARVDLSEGKRMADASTSANGFAGHSLQWEKKDWGIAAGYDFPLSDTMAMGLSLHHRRGNATISNGGTVEASGTGAALSMTYTGENGFYLDGQLSYTGLGNIKISSASEGMVAAELAGSGVAIGVEAGKPIPMRAVTLTPRGGFTWSSVGVDSFDDLDGEGSGKVELGKARSFKGRIGVLAATGSAATQENGAGRLYASLDLEHEFSPTREVEASGAALSSTMKSTWGRLGLGGSLLLGAEGSTILETEAFYATAGGGNTDYGADLSLGYRF